MPRSTRKGRSRRPGSQLDLEKIQTQLNAEHAADKAPAPVATQNDDGLADWERELLY